jgi:hypothetical protein
MEGISFKFMPKMICPSGMDKEKYVELSISK